MKYLVFPLSRLVFGGVQDAMRFFFFLALEQQKVHGAGGSRWRIPMSWEFPLSFFCLQKPNSHREDSGSIALNLISKNYGKKRKWFFIHTASGFLHINSWQILGALALTQRVCLAAEWCRMCRLDGTHLKDLESLKKSKASSHDSMQLRFNLVRVMMSQTSYPLYPT